MLRASEHELTTPEFGLPTTDVILHDLRPSLFALALLGREEDVEGIRIIVHHQTDFRSLFELLGLVVIRVNADAIDTHNLNWKSARRSV